MVCSSAPLVQRVPEWFTFLILSGWFLKLNVQLLYNSGTVLLGIYPRYMKTCVHIKTGFYMYSYKQIAALFIKVPNWKQFRYPSICGKKVKLWYSHSAMEYYSLIKRSKLLIQPPGWTSRKFCWVKKRTLEVNTYCLTPFI